MSFSVNLSKREDTQTQQRQDEEAAAAAAASKSQNSGLLSNYIVRDVFVWLVFLVFLPLILFTIYYVTLQTTTTTTNANNQTQVSQISPKTTSTHTLLAAVNQSSSFARFEDEISRPLRRISLKNYKKAAVCNDGSIADYYLRLADKNKNGTHGLANENNAAATWVILLEGGYFCYDAVTCHQRQINSKHLTTSRGNKLLKYTDTAGILSSLPSVNKYWANANVV